MSSQSSYITATLIAFLLLISCESQNSQIFENYSSNLEESFGDYFAPYQLTDVPDIACPNYFQYLHYDREYIGKLNLPASVSSDIELILHFSQRQPVTTNNYGKISLFEGRKATLSKLQHGQPITYKIQFPSQSELPKLTRISLNGQDICLADDYPRPSTQLFLKHKLQSIIQKGAVLIQPNSAANNAESPEISFEGKPYKEYFEDSNGQTTAQPTSILQSMQQQTATKKPKPSSSFSENSETALSQCGAQNSVSAFVYGGDSVMRGQFPWLTAIYIKSSGLKFLCGGSLISSKTIISAGHCFRLTSLTADRLVVNLGRHNLEDYSEAGLVIRELQKLIIHPEYSSNVFPDADLAILQMRQSVQYTATIRPICLWSESVETSLIVGQTGTVAGWGADENGKAFIPIPKKVKTNIVSDDVCLRSSQAYSILTSPRTFCAGNRDGSGPCMGDSGSGLMLNRNGRWYLRGIVSAGQTKQQKCNLLEYVVFCDVAKHLDWIKSNLLD